MSSMYTEIKYVKPKLKLYGQIAIVGSSNKLSEQNYSSKIDSFDEVVRFNRAPVEGYESVVGSKTTLRGVNNHVFENKEIKSRGYTNQPTNFIKDLRRQRLLYISGGERQWKKRYRNTHISNKLHKFDYSKVPEIKKCLDLKIDSQLQIGTVFIGLCVISDVKPTIFGFDTLPVPRKHYFEDRPSDLSKLIHKITDEIDAILKLEEKGLIEIK